MSNDPRAAPRSEARFSEEESRYLTRAPVDIAHILRQSVQKAAMVTAYFNDADGFALTSLLEVSPEEDRMVFDVPAQPSQAAGIASSHRIMFVSSHEGIKIKFQVERATPILYDGRPAFESRMPRAVLRLQRRENYRASCSLSNPVMCAVPFTSEGEAHSADMPALDVSLGGIAILNQHHSLNLEPGCVYRNCIITLPDVGSFACTIEARSSRQVQLKNGMVTMRSGCRFIDPPQSGLNMVQRYTMKRERARSAGLGPG